MKRWLKKFAFYIKSKTTLKVLKITTIILPALFVFLFELLRLSIFEEARPMIWGTFTLFIIVLIASFFFSRFVFTTVGRLQDENAHRMRELEILNEIHQNLDEFHNMNAMLNRAMVKFIQITAADSGELYLVDEQSNELVHTIHSGILEDLNKEVIQPQIRELLAGERTQLNQNIIVKNLKDFQDKLDSSTLDAEVRSLAIVPLKSMNGTIGACCLFSRKINHFKLTDSKLLLNVGIQIALAIEKTRLYEKVQAIAVLEERERISSELHDGLAQVLGYVITKSQATRELLRKMTAATDYLVELENVAQDVYTDTREAILGLRTAISGDRSMVSALREYAERFNQMHGIKTEFTVGNRTIPSLSPQIELQVIRIVQEALSNIRKHAKATHAKVKVVAADNEVTIMVEDKGKGFDVESIKDDWAKFGLRNMKERAESVRGNLMIESSPENGTKVTLSLPLTFSKIAAQEGK
jgi:signal transduction histidine kinase